MSFADAAQPATTATFTATGVYVLRLTASDSQLTASDEAQVTVFEPITGPPPQVTINSPSDGAQITSITPVRVTVSGGSWTLEYSPESPESLESPGSQAWITLATGSGAVTNSAIAQFDPTMLLNGIYSVRLRSIDASGQEDSDTIAVVVNGNLKIGNFTLSFSDLNVPVAGIPIEVIRTYDSRDKRVGDFGVGWQLGLRDIRLQKSVVLGRHWQETFTGGIIPKWCLETTRAHIITITFPDGRVYKFRMTTSPQCQNVDALRFTTVGYTLVPGLTGTAGATLRALANNDVIVDGGVPGLVTLVTGSGLYNPTLFELKTAEGMTFVIDQHEGLKSLTDLNGNTLTVNSNGIIHSSGKSIVFTRDGQGRITQITDPSGNAMSYAYDANGDLISFTDRENNVTTFGYNTTHGLLTINDPRGIQPIRNDYDANGRLVSHTDAFGKTILYDHLISASQERITDRLGNTTLYEY